MEKSAVFFTDFHATPSETLPQKLHRLMKRAGFEEIDFTDRYAAIKIHFGELGNLAHLRPQYAKVVADYVRELGGKVYLTDCNTLYVGSRKNALDHMDTAYLNGFSPLQTGCHVIIADGLKGTNEAHVPINLPLVKEAKIGQAIMDADIVMRMAALRLKTGKPTSTTINASAAAAVWRSVPKTQLNPASATLRLSWRRRLQNMPMRL